MNMVYLSYQKQNGCM